MTDEQFHEFHLDGKQMVFLFMASTVVAVVIFLCGVMVGRGVRASKDLQAAEMTVGPGLDPVASAATDTPPPDLTISNDAVPEPVGELTYPERLAEAVGAGGSRREAATATATAHEPVEARALAEVKTPSASPPARVDDKAASAVPTEPPGDGFVVQVMAAVKRTDAEATVRKLASKGYRSFLSVANSGPARYRVRVGSFATKKEADAMARRLDRVEKFRGAWVPPR